MWIEYKIIDNITTKETASTHIINLDHIWSFEQESNNFIVTFTDKVRLRYLFDNQSQTVIVSNAFRCALNFCKGTDLGSLGYITVIKE